MAEFCRKCQIDMFGEAMDDLETGPLPEYMGVTLQKAFIINHAIQNGGRLPPGNKIIN